MNLINLGETMNQSEFSPETQDLIEKINEKHPESIPVLNQALKYDYGKPDMSLHPPTALVEIAKVWTFGQAKYQAFNWQKGFTWRRPIAAALRHIFAWLGGEDKDPESGYSHLAHAACCLMMVIHFQATGTGEDNRAK